MRYQKDENRTHFHSRNGEPEEVRRAREFLMRKLGGSGNSRPVRFDETDEESSGTVGFSAYDTFLERLKRRVTRRRNSFRSQLSVYVGVNGFLFILNVMQNGPFYPWFIFPAGAMGLGLLSSYASLRQNRSILREAEQMPPLSDQAVDEFRNLKKKELRFRAMKAHFAGLGAYLLLINGITSPSVPWALIPAGIMASIYLGRKSSVQAQLLDLRESFSRTLRKELASGSYRKQGGGSDKTGIHGYEREAQAVADAILSRLENLEDVQQLPREPAEILRTYLEQVKILSSQAGEIDQILAEIPKKELAEDRKRLEEKISETSSEQLISEYRQSLAEIQDHEKAYEQLEEQRELIELRILSAINNLRKLRLDVARTRSIAQMSSMGTFSEMEKQSRELSDYIHDLAEGYREAEDAARTDKGGRDE